MNPTPNFAFSQIVREKQEIFNIWSQYVDAIKYIFTFFYINFIYAVLLKTKCFIIVINYLFIRKITTIL